MVSHCVEEDYEEEEIVSGEVYNDLVQKEGGKDMMYGVVVRTLLKQRLEGCAASLGQQAYEEVLSTVEPVLLQQLQKFVS